jgi:HAD superfamily hydrolase (TIGR01509 family)
VLVDSEGLANQMLADLLTACGHPTTLDEAMRRYMGGTLGGVRARVENETGVALPADFEERYHDALFARFRAELRAVAGVAEVLDHLDRRGVSYCVASSGTHERIRLALSLVGLLDRFERIFSAADVVRGKPAPDLFLHAAARSGVDAAAFVVVEDSTAGVAAAVAAGMRVIGYAAMPPAERLAAAGADTIVMSMADLPAVLDAFAEAHRGMTAAGVKSRTSGKVDRGGR